MYIKARLIINALDLINRLSKILPFRLKISNACIKKTKIYEFPWFHFTIIIHIYYGRAVLEILSIFYPSRKEKSFKILWQISRKIPFEMLISKRGSEIYDFTLPFSVQYTRYTFFLLFFCLVSYLNHQTQSSVPSYIECFSFSLYFFILIPTIRFFIITKAQKKNSIGNDE